LFLFSQAQSQALRGRRPPGPPIAKSAPAPVDYRICGLLQERVYIVQTPVHDTSRGDQRLEAAPH